MQNFSHSEYGHEYNVDIRFVWPVPGEVNQYQEQDGWEKIDQSRTILVHILLLMDI